MYINIFEEKFIDVSNILSTKTYMKRLSNYRLDNDSLCGSVLIDLSYFDINMEENFKLLELPYAIVLKDDMKLNSVSLGDLELEVVDQKGVNIRFNLIVDYDNYEDVEFEEIIDSEVIPVPLIKVNVINETKDEEKEDITLEDEINSNLKESIMNEYDMMLNDSLNDREVILTTDDKRDESEFIQFFNNFEAKYLKISKIQIRPEDLDEYLNKNGLTKENIKDNYDKENNILTTYLYD